VETMKEVRYVAHRGFSMKAPENTIPAFELAGRSGFWGIECDTYCTVDGEWIVHHDRTVDRMTNGTGKVKDLTYAEIQSLTIVSGHNISDYPGLRLPKLEETLAVCKKFGMFAFVEIEEYHRDADLQALVELVENSGMVERCRFICFNAEDLRKVRKLHKSIPLGLLTSECPTELDLEIVHSLAPAFLDYYHEKTTAEDILRCHKAGIEVSVWTVNTQELAQPFILAEVDYITTDTLLHQK
jgi:glycerophosphoryl diester phosphodiesterase